MAGGLLLQRRVIGKDRLSTLNVPADRLGQGLPQGRRFADPVRPCRTNQIDALSLGYLRRQDSRGKRSTITAPRS
jgi:hypothetical protein